MPPEDPDACSRPTARELARRPSSRGAGPRPRSPAPSRGAARRGASPSTGSPAAAAPSPPRPQSPAPAALRGGAPGAEPPSSRHLRFRPGEGPRRPQPHKPPDRRGGPCGSCSGSALCVYHGPRPFPAASARPASSPLCAAADEAVSGEMAQPAPGGGAGQPGGLAALALDASLDQYVQIRIFKIIVIGDSNVGKTCLTFRFCGGTFPDKTEATIGVDFREKTVEIEGEKIKVSGAGRPGWEGRGGQPGAGQPRPRASRMEAGGGPRASPRVRGRSAEALEGLEGWGWRALRAVRVSWPGPWGPRASPQQHGAVVG